MNICVFTKWFPNFRTYKHIWKRFIFIKFTQIHHKFDAFFFVFVVLRLLLQLALWKYKRHHSVIHLRLNPLNALKHGKVWFSIKSPQILPIVNWNGSYHKLEKWIHTFNEWYHGITNCKRTSKHKLSSYYHYRTKFTHLMSLIFWWSCYARHPSKIRFSLR